MNFYTQTLSPKTSSALKKVKEIPGIKDFYLSGGTALALLLGHRQSEALDFFTKQGFEPLLFQSKIAKLGKLERVELAEGTLNAFFEGVNYNYPYLLKSLVYFEDADKQPMPKMSAPLEWQKVKTFLSEEIRKIFPKTIRS